MAKNPNSEAAYNNRGVLYYCKGEYYKAIDDFNNSIRLNLKPEIEVYNCGLAYFSSYLFEENHSEV
ncbi:MAG: tetratricopeptide repeat protein [Treponema sp.]|nr:tetratricopeptide repeat protein [Treponema sp.]